jgi:hypothetical protein
MKRIWMTAGIVTVVLVGAVAVAQARPWSGGAAGAGYGRGAGMMGGADGAGYGRGPGMMGGGPGMMGGANGAGYGRGPGMMGGGPGMMGGGPGLRDGSCGMAGGGYGLNAENWDPAAMKTQAEAMLTQHKAMLASLQARLAATADENAKALLTARIELQNLMIGMQENHIATLATVPQDDYLAGHIQLAQADLDYWTRASAVDADNQALIASRKAAAQDRLTYLQNLQQQAEQKQSN